MNTATPGIGYRESAQTFEFLLRGKIPVVGLRAGIVECLRRVVQRKIVAADTTGAVGLAEADG